MKYTATYQNKSGQIVVKDFYCRIENIMYILRDAEIIDLIKYEQRNTKN
jgi:hypothetical protein